MRALQRRSSTGGLLVDDDLSALRDERRRCTDRLDAAVDEVSDATEVLSRVDCRVLLPLVEDRVKTAINENKFLLLLRCTTGLLDVSPLDGLKCTTDIIQSRETSLSAMPKRGEASKGRNVHKPYYRTVMFMCPL